MPLSFPILAFLLIAAINQFATHMRSSRTAVRDRQRLRLAYRSELTQLLYLHAGNIDRLREARGYLLSSRSCTAVYRGTITRLVTVLESEIEGMVRAYAISEQVEHLIAATTKQHGAMAFRIIEGETPVAELAGELDRVVSAIQDALDLVQDRGVPPGLPTSPRAPTLVAAGLPGE